ncbi:MAG: DUF4235 domain-containing protein [Actinobacteria bacterium]|nr:DUF4235 domain-containing protein [Actinomycetota bacterium]
MDEDKVWKVVSSASAIAAAAALKPLIERGWGKATGRRPPGNPAHPAVTWREALPWALVSGALVGVVRLVGQRGAAELWRRRRGTYPRVLATEPST